MKVNFFKTLFKFGLPTTLTVGIASFILIFTSHAATLADAYLYLNRIKANQTSGIEYILAINTTSSFTSGTTVTIEFADNQDGGWCRTAGTLTATGVTSSTANLSGTDWNIDASLPGSLSANCSKGSTGTSDKITITGVGALTAGTTYGVKIVGSTGILGTYSTAGQHNVTVSVIKDALIDSMTFKIQTVSDDQVVVSATVAETPSVSCSISTNTVNLGTLYPGGNYSVATHTITSTATNGYYWAAYGTGNGSTGDAGLYKSTPTTYLIPSGSTSTLDLRVANSEGFGITLSDPDSTGPATVATNFVDTTLGVFGTLDRGTQGAKLILSKGAEAATNETSTITYGARAGTSAVAGSYQETVTYVCGGYFSAPPWTLEFDDAIFPLQLTTNAVTIPVNTTLYLGGDSGPEVSLFINGSYDSEWYHGTTKTFSQGDEIYMSLYLYAGSEGSLLLRENNASGRIVGEIYFYRSEDWGPV